MTIDEVLEGEFHGIAHADIDGSTNYWEGIVYQVGEDLWMIERVNGHWCEDTEPLKMRAFEVTTYEYEPI